MQTVLDRQDESSGGWINRKAKLSGQGGELFL